MIKASELITKLQEAIKNYGDRTIYMEEGGYAGDVLPDEVWFQGKDRSGLGEEFVITSKGL